MTCNLISQFSCDVTTNFLFTVTEKILNVREEVEIKVNLDCS